MTAPLSYTIEQAAERLGPAFTVEWLRGHMREIPHGKNGKGRGQGGRIYFTEHHLAEILVMHEVRPDQPAAPKSSIVTRRRAS